MSVKTKDLLLVKDFLKDHYQLAIATYGDHPWIATVYYSMDDALNLYFLTAPSTLHAQHIAQNKDVAVVIADSPQAPNSSKKGLQIYGICEQITGEKKITHAITLWNKSLGVTDPNYSYAGMLKKAISGRMYKIVPKKIKFFNEDLWEEGKEKLIEL